MYAGAVVWLVFLVFSFPDLVLSSRNCSDHAQGFNYLYYYRYMRCYKTYNETEQPIPSLEGQDPLLQDSYATRTDKIRKCAKAAYGRGFKYFAMFDNGKCLSSSDAGSTYMKYGYRITTRRYCYYYYYCYTHNTYCLEGYGSSTEMNVYFIYLDYGFYLWLSFTQVFSSYKDLFNTTSPTFIGIYSEIERLVKQKVEANQLCGIHEGRLKYMTPLANDSVIAHVYMPTTFENIKVIDSALKDGLLGRFSVVGVQQYYGYYCTHPYIRVKLSLSKNFDKPTKVLRQTTYNVWKSIYQRCGLSINNYTRYKWEIFEASQDNRVLSNRRVVSSESDYVLNARSLDFGFYFLQLTVTTPNNLNSIGFDYGFLEIVPGPLSVFIDGGSHRVVTENEMLFLNGTKTYDPDWFAVPGNFTEMNFTWVCAMNYENFLNSFASLPEIVPVENQTQQNGGCFGQGSGRFPTSNITYAFNSSMMSREKTSVVTLIAQKRKRINMYTQTIKIAERPPEFDIRCTENCNKAANPKLRIGFKASCVGPNCAREISYYWDLYVTIGNKREAENEKWEKVKEFSSMILGSRSSTELLLVENFMQRSTSYRATFKVTTNEGAVGYNSYDFRTNSPPLGGSCRFNKTVGLALIDEFMLTCEDWKDDDMPLAYELQLHRATNTVIPLCRGGNNTCGVKFPAGKQNDNFRLQLTVLIVDALGAETKENMTVTVHPPNITGLNNALLQLTEGEDSNLAKFMNEGDIQSALQLSLAVLSLTGGEAVNNRSETVNKTEVKQAVIEQMTKAVVNDTKGINQLAGVLLDATNEKEDVSLTSQVLSVNAATNMTSTLMKESDVTDDVNAITGAGTQLFALSGNVLGAAVDTAATSSPAQNDTMMADVAKEALKISDMLGIIFLNKMYVGETSKLIRSPALAMTLARQRPDNVSGEIPIEGGSFNLPSNMPFGSATGQSYLDKKVKFFAENPFFWAKKENKTKSIDTSVVSLDFSNSNGEPITVRNLSSDIEILIPTKQSEIHKDEKTYPVYPGNGTMHAHKFHISFNDTAFHVRVEPLNETIVEIYVKYGERPNRTSYDFSFTLPDFSSCLLPEDQNCTLASEFVECLNISNPEIQNVESYVDPTSCPETTEASLPPLPPGTEQDIPTEKTVIYPCQPPVCVYNNISCINCSCTMIPPISFLMNKIWSNERDVETCRRLVNFVTCASSSNCSGSNYTQNACADMTRSNEQANCQRQNLCKDEVNFLSCYPAVTYDRFKMCKKILYKRPRLFYGKYGKCLRDPFLYFFNSSAFGREGDYFVAVGYYMPSDIQNDANMTSGWNETADIENALLEYKASLLRNASIAEGSSVSWEDCEINDQKCSELLDTYEVEEKQRRKRWWENWRNWRNKRKRRRDKRSVSSAPENEKPQRKCVVVEEKPPPPKDDDKNDDKTPDYNSTLYKFSVHLFNCLYFDEVQERWSQSGCKPGPNSSAEMLQCMCNHLTSFGGGFFVAPNPIDLDKTITGFSNLSTTGNIAVLATVASFFLLYLIGVVLAKRADRRDTLRAPSSIPVRTENTGSHEYEITVYTGMFGASGTTANVAMVICGDKGESEVLPLVDTVDRKNNLFARASVNKFVAKLSSNLGLVSYIRLWHDNSGPSPAWFLKQVVIRHVGSNKKSYFVCNRWLAVDKADRRIERMFFISDHKTLTGFQNLFYSRASKNLGDGHLWMSIFTRPPNSPFTRVQRLTCCLSLLLCAMLASAMFYQFDVAQTSMQVELGPIKFNWTQIIIGLESSLVVVPVNLLIITIFRNVGSKGKRQQDYAPGKSSKERSKSKLPHWILYVAYTLAFLTSLVSGFLTIAYSMNWGKEESEKWLLSVVISLVQDILVLQPLKVLVVAIVLSLILRKLPEEDSCPSDDNNDDDGDVGDEDVNDNKIGCDHTKTISTVLYSPLDQNSVEAAAEKKLKERMMRTIISEMCLQLLFILMLALASYGTRKSDRYLMNKHVLDIFKKTEKIHDERTFWYWSENVMLPGIYHNTWYNGQEFDVKKNLISDRNLFLVSLPRLRQARVRPEPCDAWYQFSNLKRWFPHCFKEYSSTNVDTPVATSANSTELTQNTKNSEEGIGIKRMCEEPFKFQDAKKLGTLPVVTSHATYEGGGLVADLGYDLSTAQEVVLNLREDKWITRQTRVIFLEMVLFEPATNIFAFVRFTFEYMATGRITAHSRVDPLSFYGSGNPTYDALVYFFYIFLVVLVALSVYREIKSLRNQRCDYFKDPWSYIEIILNITTIAAVVVFFFKAEYTRRIVRKIQENPYARMSFDFVSLWTDIESVLLAVVIFVATMKLLRIVKFNEHVSILAWTMRFSRGPLASYSTIFMVQVIAFALLGNLLFGSGNFMYSTFVRTLVNCFEMILGKGVDFAELQGGHRLIGPLYLLTYNFFITILVMNFFIAILCDSFAEAQEKTQEENEDTEMADFMLDNLKDSMKEISGNLRTLVRGQEKEVLYNPSEAQRQRDYFLY